MPSTSALTLGFNLEFSDLYESKMQGSLHKVHQAFLNFVDSHSPPLKEYLHQAYHQKLTDPQQSQLMIDLGPLFEEFIGNLFHIRQHIATLQQQHQFLAPFITVKRNFIQRWAIKKYPTPDEKDGQILTPVEDELAFALQILSWQDQKDTDNLEKAARYAAWAVLTASGQKRHQQGVLFKVPAKTHPDFSLQGGAYKHQGVWTSCVPKPSLRCDFNLTDHGFNRTQAFDHSHYCIHCHHQNKDSCSHGLRDSNGFRENTLGIPLTGCPLEQKISEMNQLKSQGYTLAALAVVTVDNPMVAATGHRICNECMRSCIYQKQESVNIPAVETQILQEVLKLPWGFEIYSLLTRWNPFHFSSPLPRPATGKKILVAGMGPSGFSLAHYLLNEGHTVVGIDGLKIEPLPPPFNQEEFLPIHDIGSLYEALDERLIGGFGGVAEYGITVRWNKNFLKIIRLLLERRQRFQLLGGVRLGGTLTIDQAFELGFDHVALCLGAGKPTVLNMENGLARGVRQASDFLMALQLTGAGKKDSVANLQIRLPIVIIGGGLTALDTATEAQAYYQRQVLKFSERYQTLVSQYGVEKVQETWTQEDQEIAKEFLIHADSLRITPPEEHPALWQQWGKTTIVYRRSLEEAPSYRLNREEVVKALQEGIEILDQATPLKVQIDAYGHAEGLMIQHEGIKKIIPARTILIAAGTVPNINLHHDIPEQINITEGAFPTFQAIDAQEQKVTPERCAKTQNVHVLMRFNQRGQSVSFFGDLHPSFAGNVVKAIASAKRGYPLIRQAVQRSTHPAVDETVFLNKIKDLCSQRVVAVHRLTPTILELVIKAPLAARSFQPGQFYRLQNFESLAPKVNQTRLASEGLALTGASVDKEKGLISTLVLEMGGSSKLCRLLKPNDPVVLMGPTGTATELPHNETVLLIGGGLGNAVLFSIGQALRANNCKVLYAAGYKTLKDRYKVDQIEKAADQILWCCDEKPGFQPTRPWDLSFCGNLVEALTAYGQGTLGVPLIPLGQIKRLLVIGSDRLMAAVAQARHQEWKTLLNPKHQGIGSINSPMQCMMKEICGQCLQLHRHPITGETRVVYSCVNQDQPLDQVDFPSLNQRLLQNSLQEKLTSLWVQNCLESLHKHAYMSNLIKNN